MDVKIAKSNDPRHCAMCKGSGYKEDSDEICPDCGGIGRLPKRPCVGCGSG